MEELLAQELKKIGVKNYEITRGGVHFESFHEIALRTILFSRFASRVYKILYSFSVLHEKDLYHKACEIKWKSLLTSEQTFKIHCLYGHLPHERMHFKNSHFTTLRLKDAIVDYFKCFDKKRPSIDKISPEVSLLLRIESSNNKKNTTTRLSSGSSFKTRSRNEPNEEYRSNLLLDLCGPSLHQRGYRISPGEAPLKENLAAAMVQLMHWDYKNETLIDAMTGSGTMAIEAALMAGDIPPSYLKVKRYLSDQNSSPWIFFHSQWFQKDKHLQENFKLLVQEIEEKTSAGLEKLKRNNITIRANERDPLFLAAAKKNIEQAELGEIIELSHDDALNLSPHLEKQTLFFCNPPYGERLESHDLESLKELYKGLGDMWKKKFKNQRAFLMTGRKELLNAVGLRTQKRHILFNGDIECRMAEYNLY